MSQVDLSTLPLPDVVETISFEAILAELEADLIARFPDAETTLKRESSLLKKVLEVAAYKVVEIRARINDASKALLLAQATGADLDNLAANFNVSRLIVTPATDNADAVLESDERLRRRVLLAIEAFSVAGPAGAYVFHAMTVAPDVRDVTAIKGDPGQVLITVMGSQSDPVPSSEKLSAIALALKDDDIRPLTDVVSVLAPNVHETNVTAALTLYPGPDGAVVSQNAINSLNKWLEQNAYLGRDLRRSAIFSRLHVDGVQSVELTEPASDIVIAERDAIKVNAVSVTVAGVDE